MSLCAQCRRSCDSGRGIRVAGTTIVPLCDDCAPAVATQHVELAEAIREVLTA